MGQVDPKPALRSVLMGANAMILCTSARGRGCAKNPVRDLAALVVLEELGVSGALSDAGSAGREGRANITLFFMSEYCVDSPKKTRKYSGVDFVYENKAEARNPRTNSGHGI
jgi:hypothetical protein